MDDDEERKAPSGTKPHMDDEEDRICHKLPHIPQATATKQHATGESLKKHLRRLSCTPYVPQATTHSPQATATGEHETGGH